MRKFLKKIKHLLEYVIFLVIINIIKLFGIDRASKICSIIARKIGPLLPVSKIARKNLQSIFGQNSNYNKIIDELWDNFGRFIGEFPYTNSMSEAEVEKRIELVGTENLVKFNQLNQPFLLFTGHFANWDFALRIIDKLYPKFGIVYRKANNPYVNKIINHYRQTNHIQLIAKGPHGAKDLLKSIKAGYAIAMLVDQKMNDGIEVPFFGLPAMTPHAIAKFALQFNYPVVPCQIIRTKGSYFKVIVHPPLKFKQTEDNASDYYNIMLQINQILEDWIRQNPGQWFWFHNRWKKLNNKNRN